MQRQEAQRLALRAAAKVAFSMSLFGCSSDPTGLGAEELKSETTGEADQALHADCGTGTCGVQPRRTFTKEQYDCCRPRIAISLDDTPLPRPTRAERVCCGALVRQLDKTEVEPGGITYEDVYGDENGWLVVNRCCDLLDNPLGPACTPWGPPVPPELEEAAA